MLYINLLSIYYLYELLYFTDPSDYESSDSSSEDNEHLTSQDPKLISRHCIRLGFIIN